MTMRRAHLLASTGILALAAALVGCTPPSPTPSDTPSGAAPTATPTATAESGTQPDGRFDLDCTDLASSATLDAAHGAAVVEQDPFAVLQGSSLPVPTAALVLQTGGLSCAWSNGESPVVGHQRNPDYVGTTVNVLADATTQWADFTDTYGPGDVHLNCYDLGSSVSYCDLNELLAGSWIEVVTAGVNADPGAVAEYEAAIAPLLDEVRGAVGEAAVSPAATPDGTSPIAGVTCDAVLSGEQFGTATGLGPAVAVLPGGGWSLNASAAEVAQSSRCSFLAPDSDIGYGQVGWLPHGRWAADAALAVATFPSVAEEISIDGAETSWVRCDGEQCIVDAVVDGDWLVVTVSDAAASPDLRAAAIAAATVMVANRAA
jgi:hypothetical protein